MTQTEILCETCNVHYYVVANDTVDGEPDFCPFCQSSVSGEFGNFSNGDGYEE